MLADPVWPGKWNVRPLSMNRRRSAERRDGEHASVHRDPVVSRRLNLGSSACVRRRRQGRADWQESGRTVEIVEHAAQSLTPLDWTCRSGMGWFRADDPVGQALVVALGVIMGDEVVKCRSQRRFSKQDHPLQT